MTETRNLTLMSLFCCFAAGCLTNNPGEISSVGPQQQKLMKNANAATAAPATPAMRMSDHKAWITRLLATPAVDVGLQQAAATEAQMIPIPVPGPYAAMGNAFFLKVNQQMQLAWLVNRAAGGETHGPWRLDNSDVIHILNSLQNPPTGAAMQTAAPTMSQ